ncbi:MAG: rhomboid family intramembrane serine protease [Kiritimatiellaeota bacterium]|nr:rhomboid family intramembrane serine protease [Kiritimatiellota bacterium]
MLDDRDYMRMGKAPFRSRPPVRSSGMSAVKTIILANIACFLVQLAYPAFTENFDLVGAKVLNGEVWRLITSAFLHDDRSILSFHLIFNMWGVYLFGSMLENRIGKAHFYWLYFISGISGSLLWTLFNQNNIPCIGASGALFGLIVAATMFFPNQELVLLFPPIPMKLKTFSIVFILLAIFFVTGETDKGGAFGNIAHLVHLGGALGGYIFIKIFHSAGIAWDIFPKSKSRSPYKAPSGWSFTGSRDETSDAFGDSPVSQKELDHLLDKISMQGINSLSDEELERLRKAREQMSGNS